MCRAGSVGGTARPALLLGLLWTLGFAPLARGGVEFYVSPTGSDANPGTKARPFASLEAARDVLRKLKTGGQPLRGGATVWLRGGVYARTRSFELGAQDSGSQEGPIAYCGWAGETPRLLGGRLLSGFAPVTDAAVLARWDEQARGRVVQADLRAQGLAEFGQLRSRGFGRQTTPAHSELFFAGRPMTLARWPNEGEWEKIAGHPETHTDEHGGKLGALAEGFLYAGDRPRRWQSREDLWVHGYWAWDWANSYERVAGLDLEKRLIRTAPPHGLYGFRQGQRFYFVNVLEELDQPGEWYLDRPKGLLYFWPPQAMSGAEVMLSLLAEPLIALNDVAHVSFRGLVLEGTRGTAVSIRGGEADTIAGCVLRMIGNNGVTVEGGRRHRVAGCDIENTGDGGVTLNGGDRQTLTPGEHEVANCHFQKQGRWSKCYVPAVLLNGVGHRVTGNLIHDHPHCAILFGGNEHRIELNEIHHVALETGDVGAIYAGRDWTFRGNIIRHNLIHHTGGVGMGSMAVYMDDCVSGTEIYGNIFYQTTRAAFLGGGRDHRVENNIFVDCDPAVQLDGRGLDRSPVWHGMVYKFMKQQLEAVPRELYRGRYPALADLDRYYATETGVPPEGNVVARNICVGGKWTSVGWHAKPEMLVLRDNLVGEHPGLVAPERLDFRLKKESPAWRLGFKPIPVERIGLQPDADRRELRQVRSQPVL
jgi:hypothetical protein